MESSKVTSKTSSLKALLLRAWRERWSDLHWGIHIKTILPRGVSGDVYNLADCILQQALVGPAPNQLVLSYLKHSLSSQLVSYASVLQRIAKYDGFQKPYCINCLLEFIETIQSGITCRGKPEEGILASAILSLVHWLLQCYQHELSAEGDLSNMLTKPASILNNMLNCGFLTSMLYLAKHDDKELYNDVVKKCHDIEELLSKQAAPPPGPSIQEALIKLCDLELGATSLTTVGNRDADVSEPLTYCVQALLAVQVRRKISAETSELANQLKLLQRLKEALPNVLCQVPGNSFELILSVAAVEGHLKYFVSKLVKFNEASKSGSGSRSLLFDVTFIMLCYVVQQYGSQEVFDDDNDSEDKSFFQRWVEGCMIEKNKPKCPDALCQQADPSVVDALLSQLNAAQPDLATIGVGWDVICLNVPAAMKEVAVAWEQGALSATDVKRILDNMKQTMCCLPICASNWLCSYMQVLQQDALLKPMNMVQQLLTPLSNEDTLQENFKERSVLMIQVIRKMQHDMHLATSFKVKSTTSHSIISKEPMSEELSEVWNGVQEKGWLTNQDTHSLENLFVTAGPNWFVYNLVKEADEIASKLLLLEEGPLMLKGPPPDAPQVPPLRGPLLHSLKILFNSFSLITEHTPYISQQTHFVFRVLEMLVMCGRDQTKPILQGMPNTLVPSLVRALPHMFSTDLVLRLYDLSSAAGRKATASDLCLLRNLELKPSI
ncbi:unnamed protein product [Nesidiocoris tenuis]|uniref:Mediator of RNA polymerase II transcription subunit 24 n=1 Tax=Nesidiocoris tenuis TaxID=355587 RepID=A0A6H5FXK4_9HEMI|nr:unnamed protein product [Nesidiocoris tenuis]